MHRRGTDAEEQPLTQEEEEDVEERPRRRFGMESDASHLRTFTKVFTLTQIIGVLVIGLIGIWLNLFRGGFAWSSDRIKQFNWHPLLMVIAMVFLYANGALIYRAFRSEAKRRLKIFHAFLMICVFILGVIGLQAVFETHNYHEDTEGNLAPISNLYSLHSWVGIIVVFLFTCQWLAGLLAFLLPGFRQSLRSVYLPLHQFFGVAIFVGAVAATLLGLNEKAFFILKDGQYSHFLPEGILINVIGIFVILFAGLVVYLTANRQFKRSATEEDLLLTDTALE